VDGCLRGDDRRMEPWEPADDLTLTMRTLMTLDANLDEIVDHVVAVRSLLRGR
jgi:hypothetical protein